MTHLDISHNQFQELPASVGHLRFLEFLDISHNDIGIIHEDFCKLSEFMNQVKRKIKFDKLLLKFELRSL